MKISILILLFGIPLCGLQAQNISTPTEDINTRKNLIMDFFNQNMNVDTKTESSVSVMVDLFIQSLVKVEKSTLNPSQLEKVYGEVVKNHILLLGNYLDEFEIEQYLNSARRIFDGVDSCSICGSALNEDRKYCVFCGHSTE